MGAVGEQNGRELLLVRGLLEDLDGPVEVLAKDSRAAGGALYCMGKASGPPPAIVTGCHRDHTCGRQGSFGTGRSIFRPGPAAWPQAIYGGNHAAALMRRAFRCPRAFRLRQPPHSLYFFTRRMERYSLATDSRTHMGGRLQVSGGIPLPTRGKVGCGGVCCLQGTITCT